MSRVRLARMGAIPYAEALSMQLRLRAELQSEPAPPWAGSLLVLEHPPTITLGKRGGAESLIAPDLLERRGYEVHKVDRGGEATCHEPGQLIAYPIVHLERIGLGVVDLIRAMVAALADAVRPYGIESHYDPKIPGLWTDAEPSRKIASVGMRVSGKVTTHGAALNITNTLEGFGLIVPCGMPDAPIARVAELARGGPQGRALFDRIREDFIGGLGERLAWRYEAFDPLAS